MVGATEDRAPLGIAFKWGMPLVNGVAITAGGLVFTGAMDAYLRAFDRARCCASRRWGEAPRRPRFLGRTQADAG